MKVQFDRNGAFRIVSDDGKKVGDAVPYQSMASLVLSGEIYVATSPYFTGEFELYHRVTEGGLHAVEEQLDF